MKGLILGEEIERKIFLIHGQKVMIDRDLAELYGVETKVLNLQVRRNKERFPVQFMFRLNSKEKRELVTNCHRFETMKHSTSMPYAFTEHGVAMLASVLKSKRAVKISIHIIDAFVRLRNWVATHKELARKLEQLERKIENHDEAIQSILKAIRELMTPPEKPKREIGFHVKYY